MCGRIATTRGGGEVKKEESNPGGTEQLEQTVYSRY